MPKCRTYAELFKQIELQPTNPKALNVRGVGGQWQAISSKEFMQMVKFLALGLKEIGLKPGEAVVIYAHTSPYWMAADIAIALSQGISVPIFTTISDEHFKYEVKETESKIIFTEVSDPLLYKMVKDSSFSTIVSLDMKAVLPTNVTPLQSLLSKGQMAFEKDPESFSRLLLSIRPEDIASIIYTSGSTGEPKGVELTHENVCFSLDFDGFSWDGANDRYLSILPLEHVFGHCFNFWMLYNGVSIYYTSDYKNLAKVCQEVQPTMMAVVPRLLQRVHSSMSEKVAHAPFFSKLIGRFALYLAMQKKGIFRQLLLPILDRLVYRRLRMALGGNLKMLISGGAHLSSFLHRFYSGIGIPVYEGWGLTEACPLSVNTPHHTRPGSVGRLLSGHEMKTTDQGEILIKGPLVMRGYLKQNGLMIDEEGFLHTGDKGYQDVEGYVFLSGRLSEFYKTVGGEKISPVPIENALTQHPLIEMALLVAEQKKFVSALYFPNRDVLTRLKIEQSQEDLTDDEFLRGAFIQSQMNAHMKEINCHLDLAERVRAFRFILEPLTVKGGDLTPSMKIKRDAVIKKFTKEIDEIYAR